MATERDAMADSFKFRCGDLVEVRSKEEILATLDEHSMLDGLPFMPQMLSFCGRRLRVRKSAHKLCDTVNATGGRRMVDAVFLEDTRCDGQAYGGCEMRCLIIWKKAWLTNLGPAADVGERRCGNFSTLGVHNDRSDQLIWSGTRASISGIDNDQSVYVCQATQLPHATQQLSRWNLRQYIEDYSSRNARIPEILAGLLRIAYSNLAASGLGFGSALRWLYDVVQQARRDTPFPWRPGYVPKGRRTPSAKLDVQVGEWVRVKDFEAILETVDEDLQNRGMSFHPEMAPHCGKSFRVMQRAGKIMNEKTGQLMTLSNECVVLDGADCYGKYANPLLCPRACYPYWREIWLERIEGAAHHTVHERPG
jgi:hypothetical protein